MNPIRKLKIGSISVLLAFGIGVFAWVIVSSPLLKPTKVMIPESNWERLFFQNIDTTTKLAKLQKLREKKLPQGDVEIRIWEGFGLENLEGVILSRASNDWQAYHVWSNDYVKPTIANFVRLSNGPKSGWESFTKELAAADIFDLPDAYAIGCEIHSMDGRAYVVETSRNNTYRTYMYKSDAGDKCFEGKKLQRIVKAVANEFENNLLNCTGVEWLSCGKNRKE